MNIRSFPVIQFILRQSWRTLFVLAVALIVMLLAGWQLASGLYRSAETVPNHPSQTLPDDLSLQGMEAAGGQTRSWSGIDGQTGSDETSTGNPAASGNSVKSSGSKGSSGSTTPRGTASSGGGSAGSASSVARNYLGIPLKASVLTLTGLNYNITNYMPNSFGGIFNRAPYTLAKISFPASLASDSISKGVVALNAAVRSTPGQKIILAHSQGAQVASHWMRQHANDPTAPGASELTFVLLGNPLRSTGGYIIGRPEVGGTTGQPTPTNTKWPIIDVARRYDGWADWVQNQSNQWAVDNANQGKIGVHSRYDQANLYAATNTVWKSGNTTYVLTKEDNLPLWKKNSDYPLGVRTAMRAHIESAYHRPANDPRVIVMPIETQAWKNTLSDWGVPH